MLVVLKGISELCDDAHQKRTGHDGEGRVEEGLVEVEQLSFLQKFENVVVDEPASLDGGTCDAVDAPSLSTGSSRSRDRNY